MLERLWRGESGQRDRGSDDRLDRRAAEIMERCGCDWFEAWFRACAELGMPGGRDAGNLAPPPDPPRQAGRAALSAQIGRAWPRDRGITAPGRMVRTSGFPATVMRSAERAEIAPDAGELVSRARDDGMPLERELRLLLEAAVGAQLDGVRVHTGSRADAAARALGARAFAVGDSVFFRDGAYDPRHPDSRRLIAHEVAHTIHARSSPPAESHEMTVTRPDDAREREAEAFADAFLRGLHGVAAPTAAPADVAQTPVERLARAGGGSSLPAPVRAVMERRFGHSFAGVRVHDSALAGEAARSVGAVAYTLGNHIVFAPGEWRPDTPEGLQLLAHELAHVIQQDGASDELPSDLDPGPADDALEHEADRAADSAARGQTPSLSRGGVAGVRRRLRRAVSKVCNPPSEWLAMAALANPAMVPSAVAAASLFGALAEAFISTDVIAHNGLAPGNFYQDNPLAGPIDPAYVKFIISKNPGLSLFDQAAIAASMVVRPDVLMHQGAMTEFEEVKPDSASGRTAGRAKVRGLSAWYGTFGLPYTPGVTYAPHSPFVIVSTVITGIPLTITFETRRDRNGLLVYNICVETDWLKLATLALLIAALIILAILSRGAVKPVPMPSPLPVPVAGLTGAESPGVCSGNCSGTCPTGTCNG